MKASSSYHYKLHSRHDEITLHITRAEAKKLLNGLACQLKKRQSKGHREFFLLTAHRGQIFHKLTVTHVEAHVRHLKKSVAEHSAHQKWVTA